MAFKSTARALNNYPAAHLPTLALVIGTVCFWLELEVFRLPQGHTTWLAWGLFAACSFAVLFPLRRPFKFSLSPGIFLMSIYLAVGFYASLLPPHLVQESDALMYHITVPRQHLLFHSFAAIPWSVPDLYLLPLDYALSSFALSTELPNKFIQFIFFAGCLGLVFQLAWSLSGQDRRKGWLAVMAVMACHAVAIQVGLAMLDLVMLYCFLAFIHSLKTSNWTLAGIELAFFFWSKAFIPLEMIAVGIIVGMVVYWARRKGFSLEQLSLPAGRGARPWLIVFVLASALIALPQLVKSYYYTGTPLYPFGIGILSSMAQQAPDHWHSMVQRAADAIAEKDHYGHGRLLMDLIKHFWLLAVPEKGVNNAFDYPVGLVYLLVLMPFVSHFAGSLRSKKLPLLSLIVVVWWLTWWFGSQQSRFLLEAICLMIIVTIASMPKISRVFAALIVMTLVLETISLINANRHDWGKPLVNVIRDKDRALLELKLPATGEITLDFPDAAFASFPVTVHSQSVYVINP